jgi:hypothetical protein
MADVSKWASKTLQAALSGATVDLNGGATIKAVPLTSSYTFDQDTHDFAADLTNEVTTGSFSRVTLSGCTVAYNTGTNVISWTFTAFTWTAVTGTFRQIAYILDTGSDATSRIIKVDTFDADKVASGNDVTVTAAGGGAATVTVA